MEENPTLVKKFFNIRTGLIGGFVLLVILTLALAYIIITPFFVQVANHSQIQIFTKDTKIVVPDVITAGEQFQYQVTGEKLVDAGADVKVQMTCILSSGASYIVTVSTYYSKLPKGPINTWRANTITSSQKLQPSDHCKLEFIGTYSFFQVNFGGGEQQLSIPETLTTNEFKLIVPDVQ